ncbi:hypothetical protein HMPREF0027_0214 [Actinobacillus ureae ATCC 25976]|uniref:Uncharacterized protein n=1 Tax=Actinobacillus ureae ATCC 25976 TaxID=887324 RepID=E8KEE7_9PAST|nr:hypothetical protein HMPREF0027_0214 [Actinobacillus ureae ATCC 25976]
MQIAFPMECAVTNIQYKSKNRAFYLVKITQNIQKTDVLRIKQAKKQVF